MTPMPPAAPRTSTDSPGTKPARRRPKWATAPELPSVTAELAERGTPVGVTVLTPGGVRTEGILGSLALHESGERDDPAMREFLASRVAAAVDPVDLGRLVVRAIQARALYVNTHQETLVWLQERIDRMISDAERIGTLR